MDPVDNPTGGGSGELAETPVADASRDAELLSSLEQGTPAAATPDPRAELWKQLESIDPKELPDNIRTKYEAPFLSQYGKKTSELDRERQALLSVVERLTTRNGEPQPTVDQKKDLLEKIAEGDMSLVGNLVEQLVAERTGPQMAYLAKNRAIQEAAEMMPELPKYEKEIASDLQGDPALLKLATMNNHEFGSRVLAALAWRRKAMDLDSQVQKANAEVEAKVKAGIDAYKNQLKGLPTSTSRAGATQGAPAEKEDKSLREIMEAEFENPAHRRSA